MKGGGIMSEKLALEEWSSEAMETTQGTSKG